jgi:hypothetical protein
VLDLKEDAVKSLLVSLSIACSLIAPAVLAGPMSTHAVSASGQPGPFGYSSPYYGYHRIPSRKALAIERLRDEALRLKAADGGVLSPANYDYLQTKLDAINARK